MLIALVLSCAQQVNTQHFERYGVPYKFYNYVQLHQIL